MLEHLIRIAQTHAGLMGLAFGVCLLSVVTGLRLVLAAHLQRTTDRRLWLAGGGAAWGVGAWAAHFITMLAFDPGEGVGYDPAITAASLLLITLVGALGALSTLLPKASVRPLLQGLTCVGGLCAMHYVAMSAILAQGDPTWAPSYVALGVVLAVAVSACGFWYARYGATRTRVVGGAVFLATAATVLNVLSIAAVTFTGTSELSEPSAAMPHNLLATMIGAIVAGLVLVTLLASWIETHAHSDALRLLRAVVEVMPDGVAYYDADDRLTLFNESYRRELASIGKTARRGVTYGDMLKRTAESGLAAAAIGREADWVAERLAIRGSLGSTDERRADGRHLRVTNKRVGDGGLVTIITDISDLVDRTEELAAARDAAEAAVRAKTAFIGDMSHELRTPLNGVVAAADLLRHEHDPTRRGELIETIRNAGADLDHLVRGLLTAASGDQPAIDTAVAGARETMTAAPQLRALVVDDNATNRRLLGLILEQLGCVATFAEDGVQALAAWATAPVDVVLMDLRMPVMDGLTAIRSIRAVERAETRQRTPIIVVSANSQPQDVRDSLAAGADGHIAKPVTTAALVVALQSLASPPGAALEAAVAQ